MPGILPAFSATCGNSSRSAAETAQQNPHRSVSIPGESRRAMERNRWETAIRCLEIAVHPNTSDEEALAAIRGFRRTARDVPMSQLSRAFPDTAPAHLLDRLDQLNQENREL